MKVLESLVEFEIEISSETDTTPLWVSEGENNSLAQIALKDPNFSFIIDFLQYSIFTKTIVENFHKFIHGLL